MTTPTVGRKVWYRPNESDKRTLAMCGDQPLDATVVAVHGEHCINVACFDANGTPFTRTSVYLVQPDIEIPAWVSSYCEWMPYQKAQHAKHEGAATSQS